jgi:hypothetical protein
MTARIAAFTIAPRKEGAQSKAISAVDRRIAISIAALVTSGALVWLYLTNPIAVAHMVEDGVAASAARFAALVATTVIKAVRLL